MEVGLHEWFTLITRHGVEKHLTRSHVLVPHPL